MESGHFTKKPESHEMTPDSHVQLLPPHSGPPVVLLTMRCSAPRVTVAASGLRLSPNHAASAVAELGVVRRSRTLTPRTKPRDSQDERFLTPSLPMPRLFPVYPESPASCPAEASRSASVASSTSLPLGTAATPVSATFSSPVLSPFSTARRLWSLVASMRSASASFWSSVTGPSPASATFSRLFFHVSSESNRTPKNVLINKRIC